MRATHCVCSVLLACATTACASAGFHPVMFAGETSAAGSAPGAGKTVYVVRNVQMKDTLLETQIRRRLEAFLLERGYILTSADTAELYVLATFGTGERMVSSTAPIYRPAEVKVDRDRDGQVIRRNYIRDRIEYVRVPLIRNSIWLQVLSSDARYFRQTGSIRNLWRGDALITGRTELLASYLPYLMVPTMKYFGRGTSDIVTVDVRDREVAWRDSP